LEGGDIYRDDRKHIQGQMEWTQERHQDQSDKAKTKLSAHVWELKDSGTEHKIMWDFIDRAPSFNPITKKCRLCLKEKYHIMYSPTSSTLNKRNEIFNTCRHRKQKLLINVKT
jgi:hypothetical protein